MSGQVKRIQQWIISNRQEVINLLSELVAQDTVNHVTWGTEQECQHMLHDKLQQIGLSSELYNPEQLSGFHDHAAYYPGKDYSNRPNLVAEWKGTGGGKSLLFSSHIDTAAIAPGWEQSPTNPIVKDGKLYGLGSFDMKGGLVASIMAVKCLRELDIQLQGNVLIESVVDEEFGGANGTVAGRVKGVNADAVIIPEPTNLALYPATRGGALWRVTFYGTTGLSFSGETIVNPAISVAKFIVFLEQIEKERTTSDPNSFWYADAIDPLPIIVTRLEAGDMSAPLCDVGPVEANIDIWVECLPNITEKQLQEQLLSGYERFCGMTFAEGLSKPKFQKMIRFLPGSEVDPSHPLIPLLSQKIESVIGEKATVTGSPFACDAFVFNEHSDSSALILGPSGANAHAPDEYVELDSLMKLIEIYALTIVDWCGLTGQVNE